MNTADAQGRILQGVVISDKMEKTIVVKVDRRVQHPRYKKFITRSSKMHAHDADGKCKIGDTVTIQETRPMSKTKSWQLLNILEQVG